MSTTLDINPKITLCFIQPSNPQQNAYIERFNSTVHYDWLSHYIYNEISELQDKATRWLWTYNHERPNMGIGWITPMQKLKLIQQQNSTPTINHNFSNLLFHSPLNLFVGKFQNRIQNFPVSFQFFP